MRTVHLRDLKKDKTGLESVKWLTKTLGPSGSRWTLRNLQSIEFTKDRDADLFLIHWF